MAILDKQVFKVNELALLEFLKQGRVPSTQELLLKIGEFLQGAEGGPTMKPRFQAFSQRWDHVSTNKVLGEISFDLQVAFEEMVEQLSKQIARASFVDLSHASQTRELDRIMSLLTNLLFITRNVEGNFYGIFDSFDDLLKTDLQLTTKDAVDLTEGVVLLPQNNPNSQRVDMSHLYNSRNWAIRASAPDEPTGVELPPDVAPPPGKDPEVRDPRIVQNEAAPQAWFGNAFADMVNAWRQVVTTSNSLGATIEFTIPISDVDDEEVSITQISLASAASLPMRVKVLRSNDNVNYVVFPNIPEETVVDAGKTVRLDFEETRVQYIRFIVTMDQPAVVNEASNSYIFGFKNISFYRIGRSQQAEFVSVAQEPTGMDRAIDSVALSTVEEIPASCVVDHFVAPADADDAPRNGIWIPIQPIDRPSREGVSPVIRFGQSESVQRYLQTPSPAVVFSTVRGLDYYQLTPEDEPLLHDPIFRQARLYRGENAWYRNTQRDVKLRQMRECFVDFTTNDVQNLYAIKADEPDSEVTTVVWLHGAPTRVPAYTKLTVSKEVDYDPSWMSMVPPINTSSTPGAEEQPRWAVYKVERIRDTMRVFDEVTTLNGEIWSQFGASGTFSGHYGVDGVDRPIVTNPTGSTIYTEGIHYNLERVEDGNTQFLSGRIQRIPTASSPIPDGEATKITFSLLSDVTYMVNRVSGKEVHLRYNLGEVDDQYFRVSYRFIPKGTQSKIRRNTVSVSSMFGDVAEEETYKEGQDYLVNAERGTITRLTTDLGRIRADSTVYVNFTYEETPPDLDTFTTWVFVERKVPLLLQINPLDFDFDTGERVAVDGNDFTQRTELPELQHGWHQFIVRSKRPEVHTNAAIKQMATLKDREGVAIFVAGGSFFSRMSTLR